MKLDQTLRLRAAALIKEISDSGDTFSGHLADELAELLTPMPTQGGSVRFSYRKTDASTTGEAAGVGNMTFEGEESGRQWGVGEKEFRCGAYVVSKYSPVHFEIRHVTDLESESNEGEILKLQKNDTLWIAYLNKPKEFSFLFLTVVWGAHWVEWKRSS